MKTSLRITVLLLLLLPLVSVLYKVYGLKLSPIPEALRDEWTVQVQIDGRTIDDASQFTLPIPQTSSRQLIRDLTFQNRGLSLETVGEEGQPHSATWSGSISDSPSFGYQFNVRIKPEVMELPRRERPRRYPKEFEPFLSTKHLDSEELAQISKIEQAILEQQTDRVDSLKRIFFYVSEEIKRSTNYESIREALELGRGSAFVKTKLFDALCRRAGIPSRITFGVLLDQQSRVLSSRSRQRLVFMNEVYINNSWYPVDLENRTMGSYPDKFVLFHQNLGDYRSELDTLRNLSIYTQPVQVNRYNSQAYYDELKRTDSFFYHISLYRLPIASQNNLHVILLLPFGTVILALFRNILGFSTFGIFTPVLLTIFFLETPFTFALLFVGIIMFIGFFQRVLLDKLYLLAVPRISILLTLVIFAYVAFIIINNSSWLREHARPVVLSYFPVVIITVLIERFSIDFIEEGPWNTFKKLIGTLVISICCYLLFQLHALKLFIFTHPELMFIAIGLNLIIGNYKGYRLSEFMRFRDLARKISA